MDIKIKDGVVLKIEGYQNIDEAVDDAFITLFTSFFSTYYQNPVTCLQAFIENQYPEFEKVIIDHLKRSQPIALYQDKIINNLTPIWARFRNDGRLKDAQAFWNVILSSVENWERIFSIRIHKGSIYYYWGGTSILDGELDKGYYLMHTAYQEDILSLNNPNPNTPAYMFVSMDFEEEKQYFGKILDVHASFLDNFIQNYNKVRNNPISKESFQKQFLAKHTNRDSVFLFSYTLARLFHTARIYPHATNNDFASLLELNVLFDLALVIDSSIQAKSNVGWQFFNLALELSKKSKSGFIRTKIRRSEN